MIGKSFGVFLITYERTEFLRGTIFKILNQNVKISKILIVDNSESGNVKDLIQSLGNSNIFYVNTGSNLGPSGAANIGLKTLLYDGFEWIYWGDDDDPPTDPNTFERLFEIANENPDAGIIGKIGGKFLPNRAQTRVFQNSELIPIVEADYVTGGKQLIISSKVVNAGILPDPKLFFGFEELEFCLRVKDAGFSILVDGQGIMDARTKAGYLNKNYRWKGKSLGDVTRVNRHYYSVRNMLYILWSRKHYLGYLFFLSKSIAKIPFSIRYGRVYSLKFSKLTLTAIAHQWIGRYGQYISTR